MEVEHIACFEVNGTRGEKFPSRRLRQMRRNNRRFIKKRGACQAASERESLAFVSNEYNVYNTSELMSKVTYAMLMTAVDSGVSNYRQAFRGLLYYRLYRCYSKLSDYRRSKRSLELSLEELGWEVVQNFMGSNRAVLRALHPRPHWSFVENLGYFISFDFNLLYSIMSVESGFDPTKISSAGACGLMQVMLEQHNH